MVLYLNEDILNESIGSNEVVDALNNRTAVLINYADENASHKRLYNILLIIAYLLAKIDETEQSCSILKEIDKLIKRHSINSKRIGIPKSVSLDTIEIKFH